jgi:hypothetical protein
MKSIFKNILPHVLAIFAFLIVSSVYFYPAWEGKSLQGEDVVGNAGKNREKRDFKKFEEETVIWNGAIFSGMPDFISAPYKGGTNLMKVYNIPQKLGIPLEVASIFWYMLGFYILMMAMKVPPKIGAGGSIAYALTSYYIIIIMAGHYYKVNTLALIPVVLAGVILCFRKKYLWGFVLTSFFLAMMIIMNHIQMMYYFLLALLFFGFIELIHHIKEKTIPLFLKTIAVLFAAVVLGIAPNYARLINYYLYNDQSIRGGSELTIGTKDTQANKGLDKDYINSWSSGVDESMMIIVPDIKGGMTSLIGNDKELLNKVPRQSRNTLANFNQYWGDQPFSGGPNYLGVVFVLLFLIGAFTINDRLRLQLLLPVILFLFLSMGGNFSAFTNLFIDYVPMYNKFRAPVSILAVAAILVSFLAIYTLSDIVKSKKLLEKKATLSIFKKPKPVYLLVSGGMFLFLLLNIAFPHLLNTYISNVEQNQIAQWQKQPNLGNQVDALINELITLRIHVFRADLWRAVIFTILIASALYLYSKKKIKHNILIVAVIVLAIVDFWGVSRRYVPLTNFHEKGKAAKQTLLLTDVDKQIYQMKINSTPGLKEKIEKAQNQFNPKNAEEKQEIETYVINKYSHSRVFNTINNPFNENITTNAHSSIGGYHAVKLRRYQDLIEHQISQMNLNVLSMLDAEYIITQNGLQINNKALGAAWFVDSVKWVNSANEEMLALNNTDVKSTVIIRNESKDEFPTFNSSPVDSASIVLDNYSPDNLSYTIKTPEDKLVVFSEVYYPYWKVFIDGKESKLFRGNYVLRTMVVPKGKHKVEFVFHPDTYYTSNTISQISFYVLILSLIVALSWSLYNSEMATTLFNKSKRN